MMTFKEYVGVALTPANQIAKKHGGKVKTIMAKNEKGKKVKHFYVESLNEESATMKKVREVVKKKSVMKVDGMKLDLTTASLIAQVYDKVNPKIKKKLDTLKLPELANLTMKVIGKNEALSTKDKAELYRLTTLAMKAMPGSGKQKDIIQKLNAIRVKNKMKPISEADGCWDGFKKVGMKKKGEKMVPNCVPENVEEARMPSMKYVIYDKKTKEVYAASTKPFDKFKISDVSRDNKVDKSDLVTKKMRKGQEVGTRLKESIEEGKGPPESFEAQFKRRVVKTTNPEHKEKGYNWRIKGKDRPEISIKLYKSKPGFDEFKKQLRRVAGHEFG